jgi:hypothetical protein
VGEFEDEFIDQRIGSDGAADELHGHVLWVPADEVVFVEPLQLVMADAAGHGGKRGRDAQELRVMTSATLKLYLLQFCRRFGATRMRHAQKILLKSKA